MVVMARNREDVGGGEWRCGGREAGRVLARAISENDKAASTPVDDAEEGKVEGVFIKCRNMVFSVN